MHLPSILGWRAVDQVLDSCEQPVVAELRPLDAVVGRIAEDDEDRLVRLDLLRRLALLRDLGADRAESALLDSLQGFRERVNEVDRKARAAPHVFVMEECRDALVGHHVGTDHQLERTDAVAHHLSDGGVGGSAAGLLEFEPPLEQD
jgi:hypothetical protein